MGVEIKLDEEHYLVSDTYSWKIATKQETKEGPRYTPLGHYVTLDGCLDGFVWMKARKSDSTTAAELSDVLDSTIASLQKVLAPILREVTIETDENEVLRLLRTDPVARISATDAVSSRTQRECGGKAQN